MALSTPVATGFVQSFKSALGDVDTSAMEPLGTIRYELNAVFKYVKFSGTNAVAIGDCLCYVVSDTTLQTVDAANSVIGAGVAVAVVAAGTVQYGWIQIRGVATISTALGAGAAGNALTNISASAKTLTTPAADTSPNVATCIVAATPLVQLNYPN